MHMPETIDETFTDSEAWGTAMSDWNLHFRQLDCGPLQASIERVMCPKLVVQRVKLSRRFHQSGFAPSEVLTFGLPDQFDTIKWYGESAHEYSLMNFNRRSGFDAVSEAGFGADTLSIGSDAFQQEAAALGLPISGGQVASSADQYLIQNGDLKKIRAVVLGLLRVTSQDQCSKHIVNELQNDLIHLLVRSVADPDALTIKSNYSQRHRAVERALDFIRTNSSTNSLKEIYEYSGISYRTLNRAFKERFGVSPKQYIVAMKLVEVRKVLVTSGSTVRITDVASDWGFWHLGRFASDYKRMFGELPSDTLRSRVWQARM